MLYCHDVLGVMIVWNSQGLSENTKYPLISGVTPGGNLILKFRNILAVNNMNRSGARNRPKHGRFPRENGSNGSLRICWLSNMRPFSSRNLSGLNSNGFSQLVLLWWTPQRSSIMVVPESIQIKLGIHKNFVNLAVSILKIRNFRVLSIWDGKFVWLCQQFETLYRSYI